MIIGDSRVKILDVCSIGATIISWLAAADLGMMGGFGLVLAAVFFGIKALMLLVTLIALIRRPALAKKVWLGRWHHDQHDVGRALEQAMCRWTWEWPQSELGYIYAQIRVIHDQIDRVEYLHGVTYVMMDRGGRRLLMGMSLGNVVNIWLRGLHSISKDFESAVKYDYAQIFMHEFGHTIDSMRWGWLYLPVIGIPSLFSMVLELTTHGKHQHKKLYAERWANRNAEEFFKITTN